MPNSATSFKIVAWSGDGKITVPVEGPLPVERVYEAEKKEEEKDGL